MPDLPQHRPALAGLFAHGDVCLDILPEGHLLQVMGAMDAAALGERLAKVGLAQSSVRPAGFQQWFLAGNDALPPSTLADLTAVLAGDAFLSDQSHGRIRIGVSGGRAADLLSKGTAVDLHPATFAQGQSAMALFGHIAVQLTRTGPDRFELTVLRSFAESLWEDLERLAAAI